MEYQRIHLKDTFDFLGEDGKDPQVEILLRENMAEMKRQDRKRPCLIVCPGGGYGMCSHREAEPIALPFSAAGYNVFILWYSVSPKRFPSQLREVAAVMELIYRNAEEWGCDTDRIAIIGFSAGGHLAAHYTNAYDWQEVREVFPESKPVNACILGYPVISADPSFAHIGSFLNLLGHELSPEERERFSCNRMVTPQTPPTFLWHTAEDNCVPVKNSLAYAEALSENKVPFELRIFPYGWHGLATVNTETNDSLPAKIERNQEWLDAAIAWLNMIFSPEKV